MTTSKKIKFSQTPFHNCVLRKNERSNGRFAAYTSTRSSKWSWKTNFKCVPTGRQLSSLRWRGGLSYQEQKCTNGTGTGRKRSRAGLNRRQSKHEKPNRYSASLVCMTVSEMKGVRRRCLRAPLTFKDYQASIC